jgi:gliding motility associated protien GldN
MKSISNIISVLSIIIFVGNSFGQPVPDGGPVNIPDAANGVVDGVFVPQHVPTKKPMVYEDIREADYIWSKRVFRRIDLREKMNYPLKYPLDKISFSGEWVKNSSRWSLWTIMRNYIIEGDLVMYEVENPNALGTFNGDQFTYPIRPTIAGGYYRNDPGLRDKMLRYFGSLGDVKADENGVPIPLTGADGQDSIGLDGNTVYPPRDTLWIDGDDVVAYDLKEDWFFDKERSVLDVRIIGIAPVVNWTTGREKVVTYNIESNSWSDKVGEVAPLYWLYFPQLRPLLAKYYVYNEDNDAQWMSFDDFFWKRRFSSIIYKESNVFDRQVESYRYGIDALIESEAITEEIRTLEHDMWNF